MKESNIIKLSFVGDVYLGPFIKKLIKQNGTKKVFDKLWGHLDDSHQIIINLEGPITKTDKAQRSTKVRNFKSSLLTTGLYDKRFIFNLANNHIMDFGKQGLYDTIAALNEKGFSFTGAGRNLDKAGMPLIREVNGFKIGYIFVADSRFDAAGANSPGTYPARHEFLIESFKLLRSRVDIIIVVIHMGMMYTYVPTPLMISLSNICLGQGADVVQFHHSHNISGITKNGTGVVFWGTGNYAFTDRDAKGNNPWHESGVFNIEIDTNTKKIVNIKLDPILINENGIPEIPEKRIEKKIYSIVKRWSKRIEKKRFLGFWRVIALVNPVYLFRFSLPNYFIMARNDGIKSVLQAMLSTITTQFIGRDFKIWRKK